MEILVKTKEKVKSVDSIYFEELDAIKAIAHPLRIEILKQLTRKPNYPKAIARKLNIPAQKLQYHFKILERYGLVEKVKEERISGSVARFYSVTPKLFVFNLFGKALFKTASSVSLAATPTIGWINYFVKDGLLNAKIVVGSPDLHGRFSARARDGWCAAELCLFLGKYVFSFDKNPIILDTAFDTEELKQNLILIGGPITNTITARINKYLPLYFDVSGANYIVDRSENKRYTDDNLGIVVLIDNPFAKEDNKKILVCAGKKMAGTRAAILALIKYPERIPKNGNFAILVDSVDKDSDGIVDDVNFIKV